MPESQIKSKERVAQRGEVFTAEREVNAMLDLVRQETERIDSRFLEPACGNGNFLVEILRRKLLLVSDDCGLVQAVSSIYGIDIMQDNVEECRERLLSVADRHYGVTEGELRATVRYVLSRNILWGDALTLCEPNVNDNDDDNDDKRQSINPHPIIFSEWGFIGRMVRRRDYTLDMLLRPRAFDCPNLFSDLGDETFIPKPCAEFPPINYLKIYTQDAKQ